MNADQYGAAVHLGRPAVPNGQARTLRRRWGVITALIVAAVFIEAVFAGAMLSGAAWARAAHAASALALIASTVAAALFALVTLRRVRHGLNLGLMLLALAAVLFVQTALGVSAAHGANLLWLHVPLGVALLGLAALAVADARGLGDCRATALEEALLRRCPAD
jgi:hypothetical protein